MEHPEPKSTPEVAADCATPDSAPPAQPPVSLIARLDFKRHALTGLLGLALVACGGGGGDLGGPPFSAPAPGVPVVVSHTYVKNSGPTKNPHKGWNSGWGGTFPEASVGFQYLHWSGFEPKDNEFDYAVVEQVLAQGGSKGKHFILRLFCDWGPTDTWTLCPNWLYSDKGVQRIQGANGTYITDYNNPKYVSEAVQAIEALASRYNNDPRVHAIQIGVLGYWGEWHTAGFTRVGGGGYTISEEAKDAVLNAYKTNFTNARIQGRYPWAEPLKSWGGIGFHNDFFVPNHRHSEQFDTAISAGEMWLNGPIGGETPPRDPAQRAAELQMMHATPKGASMIAKGHYSTMAGGYRVGSGAYAASSMNLHRMMGYNYQISSADFPNTLASSQPLAVQLNVDNVGVAPMYYPWEVQFALLKSDNSQAVTFKSSVDLRTLREGRAAVWSAEMPANRASRGQYRLAVRIIQPQADTPAAAQWKLDARNAYVEFANDLTVLPGLWDSTSGLQGGWSILGDVEVK